MHSHVCYKFVKFYAWPMGIKDSQEKKKKSEEKVGKKIP